MFVREDLNTSLTNLHEMFQTRDSLGEDIRVPATSIRFQTSATDPVIVLGDSEVPANSHAMEAFAGLLQIPTAALKRFQKNAQASTVDALLNDLARNTIKTDAKVTIVKDHLHSVADWTDRRAIKPLDIIERANNVLPGDAHVARLIDTPDFFSFDVYAPEGFEHGYGVDGVTAYADGNERDDITSGGLRLALDLKRGLAPSAEEWLFRLACTNGMTVPNTGLKIDARGSTIDEVLADLERVAEEAFSKVERDIAAFYEMKSQKVDNVERAIRTIARERGIPDRSTIALIDLAASDDIPNDPSRFDVVNLITNFANSPRMAGRVGGRDILEAAGGATISEHAARCGHCQQKVH